jgi:serine/threonine protein kinase
MPGQELIGRQLGDYTIVEMLGHGGMAHVYKGYDANLQRYAAVKVIEPDKLPPQEEAEYRERFLREARAIARLSHPRIVGVYQFGQTPDGLYYMAMQFVDGRDLRFILKEYMRRGKRPGSRHILRIMRDITSALDHAHRNGVIHRDVKPSNIMISQDGSAILTDFGLVLTASERTLGNAFGSVHYVAPEQAISSDKAVAQSDLYALGVVLFEMLTGRVPFDDVSGTSVAIKHIQEAPPLPRSLNTDINPALEDVILKMLDKSPANRYRTGAEFIAALEAALVADSGDSQEINKLDSKSRPIIPPNPDLIPSETQPVGPTHEALSPNGASLHSQISVAAQLLQKPLSSTPTPAAQRTRLDLLDPAERLKIQEMETITDSSKSSQLREQMNSKLRALKANRGGMGLAVGGIALALIIGVLTLVLLGRDANNPANNSSLATSTTAAIANISSEMRGTPVPEKEERTVSSTATVTDIPPTTSRRTPIPTTGSDETIAGATTNDSVTSPTIIRTRSSAATSTSMPATETAISQPRATSTRQPSEEIEASPETLEVSLPGLEADDGEGQVLLRYDSRSLVLFNRAPRFIDVSDLDFVMQTSENPAGQPLFNSNDWENSQLYVFRNANCFQLWSMDFIFLEADEFPADICDYRQGYQQVDVPFWVGDTGQQFSVERDGVEYGVCPVVLPEDRADNRCVIELP